MSGSFELSTPRDREGNFSPQFVKKHQTTMSDELEQKILALYGLGMSYKDISGHLLEMYGVEISTGALTAITDKIIDRITSYNVCYTKLLRVLGTGLSID